MSHNGMKRSVLDSLLKLPNQVTSGDFLCCGTTVSGRDYVALSRRRELVFRSCLDVLSTLLPWSGNIWRSWAIRCVVMKDVMCLTACPAAAPWKNSASVVVFRI